jgi:predicted HTH domain antitoxin
MAQIASANRSSWDDIERTLLALPPPPSAVEWSGNHADEEHTDSIGKEEFQVPTVELDLPDEAFSALRRTPDELGKEMRLAAAIYWYAKGDISQERAASIAGLDRTDFLLALAREGIDAFTVDLESLRRELEDE